jgi:hypothetical protein
MPAAIISVDVPPQRLRRREQAWGRVVPSEQVADGSPEKIGDAPPPQVSGTTVHHMAALAECHQTGRMTIVRIMLDTHCGQDDAPCLVAGVVQDAGPFRLVTCVVTPGALISIIPAPIRQLPDLLAVWSIASFTTTLGAAEANSGTDLRPVDRIKPAELGLNGHRLG